MNRERVESIYRKFCRQFGVNIENGVLNERTNLKFATMPYIGSNYFLARKRLLFVGMDIGKDETPGKIQSLEERRVAIECDVNFNPHIAGTFCTALYYLKTEYDWEDVWDKFSSYPTYSQATKVQHHKDGENPISFVALTNLHKFVTIDRENRTGDVDRKFLEKEVEESWLLKEIKLLRPDIVFLQSKTMQLSPDTIQQVKDSNVRLLRTQHPAFRPKTKGEKSPISYVNNFEEI